MFLTSNVSQKTCRRAKSRHTRAKLLAASLIAALTCSTGCTLIHNAHRSLTYSDSWNEAVLVMRNRNLSTKAWHKRKHHFCNERYSADFAAGFRQGYEDVANGGNGCTPAMPPRSYWTWEFQSAEGQARTSAWFSGYPHGARAAEEDGIGNYTQLQLSSHLQAEYQQAGVLPAGPATYPIVESSSPLPNSVPSIMQGTPVPMQMGEPTIVPIPQSGN